MSYQCLRILNALRDGPKTTLQLVEGLHIMSVTRRIFELRKAGFQITSTHKQRGRVKIVTYTLEV